MWSASQTTLSLLSSLLLTAAAGTTLLAADSSAAQQPNQAVSGQTAANSAIDDARIDESVHVLLHLQASGQLQVSDVTGVDDLLGGWCEGPLFPPDDQGNTRQRLRFAIENLVERLVNGWETRLAILELELAILDARMDRALGWLQVQARERGATREQYQRVVSAWTARAQAHLEGYLPSMEHFLGRFYEILDNMVSRAIAFESGFDQLQLAVIEARLQRSLHFLRIHAERRGATRAQFEAYVTLLHQRARLRAAVAQGV